MAIRTSNSDPLRISYLAPGVGWGLIGMTLCPGKHQNSAQSGNWERQLDVDLIDIRNWGASHVVSILTNDELQSLKVTEIGPLARSLGMTWHQLDVPDGGLPDSGVEQEWTKLSGTLLDAISRGKSILFHCKGGLGRTGMFAARFLAEYGLPTSDAIRTVRKIRPGAIETAAQLAAVREQKSLSDLFSAGVADIGTWSRAARPKLRDRFAGCLLGGAVGDALGAPVEFMTLSRIRSKFGLDGINDYVEAYGQLGAITDDTQMTMFTAEGCIRYVTRGMDRGMSHPLGTIERAYDRWLLTQGEASPLIDLTSDRYLTNGWLFSVDELHDQRAPGNTCLSGLIHRKSVDSSKGCGGVMRVAPIGLLGNSGFYDESISDLGGAAARITHGHPTGYLAAGAFAELIMHVVKGVSVEDGLELAIQTLRGDPRSTETIEALEAARQFAIRSRPSTEAIETLGAGWTAEEALAIGVYSVLVTETLEQAVVLAVNHSGDSDSTGSIAGQIAGARDGVTAIPERWLAPLELHHEIAQLSHDFHSLVYYGKGSDAPRAFSEKYPPN